MINKSFIQEMENANYKEGGITGRELAALLGPECLKAYDEGEKIIQQQELNESKKKFFEQLNKMK